MSESDGRVVLRIVVAGVGVVRGGDVLRADPFPRGSSYPVVHYGLRRRSGSVRGGRHLGDGVRHSGKRNYAGYHDSRLCSVHYPSSGGRLPPLRAQMGGPAARPFHDQFRCELEPDLGGPRPGHGPFGDFVQWAKGLCPKADHYALLLLDQGKGWHASSPGGLKGLQKTLDGVTGAGTKEADPFDVIFGYESLIAARILQALGGGAIQPIGMAIVAELFEPHERGKALGIWGMGIMAGPAIGPDPGRIPDRCLRLADHFSVNLPVGVLTLLAGMIVMRPLRARGAKRAFRPVRVHFLSMALIAGLTALSNGQDKGWNSDYIHVCEAITVVGLVMFIAVELAVEHPLLDLRLFLIRNYLLSILLAIFRAVGLFGSIFLFPIFLQNLMGYTPVQAGLWMLPNAVAVGVTMPLAGWLADRYRRRC